MLFNLLVLLLVFYLFVVLPAGSKPISNGKRHFDPNTFKKSVSFVVRRNNAILHLLIFHKVNDKNCITKRHFTQALYGYFLYFRYIAQFFVLNFVKYGTQYSVLFLIHYFAISSVHLHIPTRYCGVWTPSLHVKSLSVSPTS